MSLETKLLALVNAIGPDIKDLHTKRGALGDLTTTDKTSIVLAINEIVLAVGGLQQGSATILDTAGDGDSTVTWSADKIWDSIEAAKTAVKDDLTDGAATALDTLKELATALGDDPAFATTIATALGLRVSVDAAQSFDTTQQAQGRSNIGAAAAADLTDLSVDYDALVLAIGDTEQDLAAAYATAKA